MFTLVRYQGLGRNSAKSSNSLSDLFRSRIFHHLFYVIMAAVLSVSSAEAQLSVTLNWHAPNYNTDGSPLHDLDGYLLHWGTAPGVYDFTIDVGDTCSYTMDGLGYGRTYYFAAQAYTTSSEKSAFSNEMVVNVPLGYTGGGGSIPGYDPGSGSNPGGGSYPEVGDPDDDYDGDGISNGDEGAIGTNPADKDTDDDGVDDGQELEEGTNPNDKGSVIETMPKRICAEWNGFLDMYNIFEHVNLGSRTRVVKLELSDMNGNLQNSFSFSIEPGEQFDVLVHDIHGHQANSYGMVCSTHDGSPGEIDGRMVYYRQRPGGGFNDFEFAFAMPVSQGRRASQFVGFNTFQPSLNPRDGSDLVANWLQLTNMGDCDESGRLIVYNSAGAVIANYDLTVPGRARIDTALHALGASLVGLVEWRPHNSKAMFMVRNARYLYDNPGWRNSFATAFFAEGQYGSGQHRVVPLNTTGATAVLELSNVLSEKVTAYVDIYDFKGLKRDTMTLELEARSTFHVIADPILQGKLGMASVRGSKANSLLVGAMQYGRNLDLSIKYMYGVPAAEPRPERLRGSYNTFLGQDSQVVVINTTDEQNQAYLTVGPPKDVSAQVTDFNVAEKGVLTFSLGEPANTYGMVKVQPESGSKLAAWVLRILPTADGSDIADIIPIQLR